ncbi:MAG: NAD(P)-dependent oxidoreductase [Cohnella sp.]|nr:NAD(P)-dependent oxidoreductase [Cohnella sp.]
MTNQAKKVVVTGGSGMLGKWVVKHFVEHGYEVLSVDTRQPEEQICPTLIVDLQDLGQTYGALAGADAVVHMAAIPRAGMVPPEVTFRNNVMSTYNVLEAASGLGIKKAVIASSESSYGICFAVHPFGPQYVPMDEAHPQLPQDSYGLSKIVNEQTADMFHRRTGIQVVSFRLGNVIPPEWYERFPSWINNPEERERILWSYIDTRDAAEACRLAIEAEGLGSVALNLGSDETSMAIPSRELMAARYPETTDFRAPLEGHEALLNSGKAMKLLGWKPKYKWREQLGK